MKYMFLSYYLILPVILLIINIISYFKIFKKFGLNPFLSLIPIYNVIITMKYIKMSLLNILYIVLSIVSFNIISVNITNEYLLILYIIPLALMLYFIFSYNIKLSKSFGRKASYGILLTLFNPFLIVFFAFSKRSKYITNSLDSLNNKVSEKIVFEEKIDYKTCSKCKTVLNSNAIYCPKCNKYLEENK